MKELSIIILGLIIIFFILVVNEMKNSGAKMMGVIAIFMLFIPLIYILMG